MLPGLISIMAMSVVSVLCGLESSIMRVLSWMGAQRAYFFVAGGLVSARIIGLALAQ